MTHRNLVFGYYEVGLSVLLTQLPRVFAPFPGDREFSDVKSFVMSTRFGIAIIVTKVATIYVVTAIGECYM